MAWREPIRLCGGLLLSFFPSPPYVRPLPTLVGSGLWVRGRHTPLPGVGSEPYPQVYPRKQRCVCEFVGVGGVNGWRCGGGGPDRPGSTVAVVLAAGAWYESPGPAGEEGVIRQGVTGRSRTS